MKRVASAIVAFGVLAGCAGKPPASVMNQWADALLAEGKMRTERAPIDAPFDNETLVENFRRVALHSELVLAQETTREARSASSPIHKWGGPIRYGIFGAGATPEDQRAIHGFMARMAELTGLEIVPEETGINFVITITSPEERPHLSEVLGGINGGLQDHFDAWRRSETWVCGGSLIPESETDLTLQFALIFIGDEAQGLLRRSCIEEEISQSLGLRNDDMNVRPSIFNDDEEFALMTVHDDLLMRVLYDPRLQPGMTETEAMPLARRIVAELRPQN